MKNKFLAVLMLTLCTGHNVYTSQPPQADPMANLKLWEEIYKMREQQEKWEKTPHEDFETSSPRRQQQLLWRETPEEMPTSISSYGQPDVHTWWYLPNMITTLASRW